MARLIIKGKTMKYAIIAAALFASTAANADVFATLDNKDGGKIVLTTDKCIGSKTGKEYQSLRRAFAYSRSGASTDGCWAYADEMVIVAYDDGTTYRYPPAAFEIKGKK